MQKILKAASLLLLLNTQGCVDDAKPDDQGTQEVDAANKLTASNSAGNLVSSAVKEYFDVDVALIPSAILKDDARLLLTPGETLSDEGQQQVLGIYDAKKDTIRTGTMKGSAIKEFILKRMTRYQDVDLQVAGIRFDLKLKGGWPEAFVVKRDKGLELEDDRKYRVAVSDFFYDYKKVFPGYYFGDNMNFSLNLEADGYGSIKEALTAFLAQSPVVPPLDEPRGYVSNEVVGDRGLVTIAEIQGVTHLSPLRGYRVTTRGVVTAVGQPLEKDVKDWADIPDRILPTEIIIQDPQGDGDDRTSEGLSFTLPGSIDTYKVGQFVEVSGVVHEIPTVGGFSGTSLRKVKVDDVRILPENQPMPKPVVVGLGGRLLANKLPSTFPGNQNARAELQPGEGIDFWEVMEHMWVMMKAPRVSGVRGGAGKEYIEVSIVAEGMDDPADRTDRGGNFYNPYLRDFNTESIKMVNNNFSQALKTNLPADNGDYFQKDLVGIVGFQLNTFGNGRHVFYPIESLGTLSKDARNEEKNRAWAEEKKHERASAEDSSEYLKFATWNVENLSASTSKPEQQHMDDVAKFISEELNCPDILNMPEIQDNNGVEVYGGSAADRTLATIIRKLQCPGSDYQAINIDPIPFRDGGEFGGNIRVAMIYNAKRVSFTPKGVPTATSETFIDADGSLSQNPGRIDPRNPILESSRKSLVAEFVFRGQKVFVIGNHFNSMIEEGSPLGAIQPYSFKTEVSRSSIAGVVRQFIEKLRYSNPDVKLIVAGDFNTYHQSNSLRTMAGDFLINMMTAEGMCPRDEWYTTNYDGNAGAIDYIFASPALMAQDPKFRILHLNSAFIKRVSDHDPILARFKF